MTITKGQIFRYALLPEVLPRLFSLFGSGFANIAFLIAQIYGNLRLLPPSHPYLQPQNFGRFGIRQVIAQAAENLVFSRKNIDQIIIFFTVLTGLVILTLQVILFAVAFFSQPVLAASSGEASSWANWFQNTEIAPDNDIAFIILDRVFGTEGIFDSCISKMTPCVDYRGNTMTQATGAYPYPLHKALHTLFSFYSYGIFYVAVIIILYFVVTIAAETSASGTPFGKRFNKTWVVPRLILFFALLTPLNTGDKNEGLNGGQLITLYAARYGSNFATNGWLHFNNVLTGTYLGDAQDLIARPQFPETSNLLQFMYLAKTCQAAENLAYGNKIDAYIVRNMFQVESGAYAKAYDKSKKKVEQEAQQELYGGTPPTAENMAKDPNYQELVTKKMQSSAFKDDVKKNILSEPGAEISTLNSTSSLSDEELYALSQGTSIKLIETNYEAADIFSNHGNILLRFGVKDEERYARYTGSVNPLCGEIDITINDVTEAGSRIIQKNYFSILQHLWANPDFSLSADCVNRQIGAGSPDTTCSAKPDKKFVEQYKNYVNDTSSREISKAIERQIEDGKWSVPPELKAKGWAGAAIWYNRIAQMNGAVATAIFNFPHPGRYPYVMEYTAEMRQKYDTNPSALTRFEPTLGDGQAIEFKREKDGQMAATLNVAYRIWLDLGAQGSKSKVTSNAFSDTINAIFGTSGIFDMRNNTNVHPLAQLSALGKGMMEATIRNAMFSFAGAVGGGMGGLIDPFFGIIGKNASGVFKTLVMSTLALGFTLFYVLPALPFVYFFFAVSGWVKSIFEAMVGIPLWALGHIKIDGEGLPGQSGSNGYFLIFEIFVRPILILFGLLASISIFAALVSTLNDVFDLVTENVGGFDNSAGAASNLTNIEFYRNSVDQFFFTAMYVIICYMMGLACFKLIDQIPNKILRWMGFGIGTFQESAGDPASKITSKTYGGTQRLGFTLQRLAGDMTIGADSLF